MSEFLVRGRYVITMANAPDPSVRNRTPGAHHDTIISDGAVHVRDGHIQAVDTFANLAEQHRNIDVHGDGTGIVFPGLISTHTHLSESLATGMGSELSLFEWGEHIIDPLGSILTREIAAQGTALRAIEMLLTGVTTVNDMFCHTNTGSRASLGAVDGLERAGMRAVVAFGSEDLSMVGEGESATAVIDDILAEQHDLADRIAATDLIYFRYGIGTLLGQSDDLLKAGVGECQNSGWGVHTHLAEVREELTAAVSRWGKRTIDHADDMGLFERPFIAGHGIWLSEHDIATLARSGAAIAHSPVANMILASGVCPVPRLRSAGIAVGIGTDGAASNDSQDMLGAIKTAALLQKVHHLDARAIDAFDVLQMATIDGARALGLDHLVGSLEPGKRADIVLAQDTVDVAVLHDPISQLVYGASPRSIRDVWVDGRHVVSDHRCTTIDETEQIISCRPLVEQVGITSGLAAAGHSMVGR